MYIGYTSGAKELLSIPLMPCPACEMMGGMAIYEKSFKPTVMFIPVAKLNVKYYVICKHCERGLEIDKPTAQELLGR